MKNLLVDVRFTNHGSINIMHALTAEGCLWIDEHIEADDSMAAWGGGIVVENRYVEPIMLALHDEGLSFEFKGVR
jgi:hypothetical protein